MKVFIKTLGCKANWASSDKLASALNKLGIEVTDKQEKPIDYLIVNTCTITHLADKKSRQALNLNKNCKKIVFGCGAIHSKNNFKKNIDYIFKNETEVLNFFEKIQGRTKNIIPKQKINRTRAFIKIQDGCNNFCSYCIVPFVRGREKSLPLTHILQEIKTKIRLGHQEIVLTGINIGKWKRGKMNFTDLLKKILKIPPLKRLRLGSLEPENFPKDFYELLKNPKFCNHLHICLQSGSDKILKKMNRKYTSDLFLEICKKLKKIDKNLALTTDLIVGFPGEKDADFKKSLNLCKKIAFSKIHIFKFSKRSGTFAAKMSEQTPEEIKRERSVMAAKLEKKLRLEYLKKFLNKKMDVLIEQKKGQFHSGLTTNYLRVFIKNNSLQEKQIYKVRLKEIKNGQIFGILEA